MRELRGRVAVVTGGGSGIGRGLCRRFAAEGMKVVVADVDLVAAEQVVRDLTSGGAEAIAVAADVSDATAVDALAQRTIEAFGAVHVVCNNAGVESGAPFTEVSRATWDWVMRVNFGGVLNGCLTFLPLLREAGEGHIVNTTSLAAFQTGVPTMAPYEASKGAVLTLTEALALELRAAGEPIGVSLLVPGMVDTRMTEAERTRPESVPSTAEHPMRQQLLGFLGGALATVGMDPAEVAAKVVDAIHDDRFYVLTHPDEALAAEERRRRWMEHGEPPAVPGA